MDDHSDGRMGAYLTVIFSRGEGMKKAASILVSKRSLSLTQASFPRLGNWSFQTPIYVYRNLFYLRPRTSLGGHVRMSV